MLTTLLLGVAPLVLGAALAGVAAWRLNHRIGSQTSPGYVPALAEIDLRRSGLRGEEYATEAACILQALTSARTVADRPVSANEVRAGLMDPGPARARLGAQGTPGAYDHANNLAAYEHHPDRGLIAALVEQALTDRSDSRSQSMPEQAMKAPPPRVYALQCHDAEAARALAELFGTLDADHRVEAEGPRAQVTYLREPWLLRVADTAHSRDLISSHAHQQVEEEVLW